jgi:tRNA(Arg) A34 adenosine deaminase TadA
VDTEIYIKEAIKEALNGIHANEGGPFGACMVLNEKTIATAHNTVLLERDPTCHAEMNCIRAASRVLKSFDLSECILFTTSEPCPMCLGAIYWARIRKVFFGLKTEIAERYGFNDVFVYKDLNRPHELRFVSLSGGICEEKCLELFQEWHKLNGQLY